MVMLGLNTRDIIFARKLENRHLDLVLTKTRMIHYSGTTQQKQLRPTIVVGLQREQPLSVLVSFKHP